MDMPTTVTLTTLSNLSHFAARQHPIAIAPHRFKLPNQQQITITPGIYEYSGATVLGGEWVPILQNGLATFEGMVHTPAQYPEKSKRILVNEGQTQANLGKLLQHEGNAVLVGGSWNHYHWLIDYLPRLLIADSIEALDNFSLITNAALTPIQQQALELLDISTERLLPLADDESVRISRLAVPTLLSTTTLCHPEVPRLLRRAFPPRDALPPQRIYISHEGASSPVIKNEEELMVALNRYGFRKVLIDKLSFQEQIDIYSSAEIVVAPHCSELSNIVFMSPRASLVEISSKLHRITSMRLLAQLAQCQHFFADAEIDELENPNPMHNDWTAPVDQISAILAAHPPGRL